MAVCPVCAAEVRPSAKFCGKCGARATDFAPASPAHSSSAQTASGPVSMQAPTTPAPAVSQPAAARRSAPRIPAITSKSRSKLRLEASTSLRPSAVLDIVRASAGAGKGGGVSLLTTGIANLSAGVHVEAESDTRLGLSITSGKRLVELCTFSAEVTPTDNGTSLRVGGLETYKTVQTKAYGFVPAGPKRIMGYDPYRHFLEETAARLLDAEPAAVIDIVVPD